jgi:hypothetical protein
MLATTAGWLALVYWDSPSLHTYIVQFNTTAFSDDNDVHLHYRPTVQLHSQMTMMYTYIIGLQFNCILR